MTGNNEPEIRRIGKSFRHAARGLKHVLLYERNFQIEIFAAVLVVGMILLFKIKNWEAIVLILMITWVLVIELINTVVERVVDILKPRIHPYARLIKDIMAAAVLVSSAAAALVGVIVFLPYFCEVFF